MRLGDILLGTDWNNLSSSFFFKFTAECIFFLSLRSKVLSAAWIVTLPPFHYRCSSTGVEVPSELFGRSGATTGDIEGAHPLHPSQAGTTAHASCWKGGKSQIHAEQYWFDCLGMRWIQNAHVRSMCRSNSRPTTGNSAGC